MDEYFDMGNVCFELLHFLLALFEACIAELVHKKAFPEFLIVVSRR